MLKSMLYMFKYLLLFSKLLIHATKDFSSILVFIHFSKFLYVSFAISLFRSSFNFSSSLCIFLFIYISLYFSFSFSLSLSFPEYPIFLSVSLSLSLYLFLYLPPFKCQYRNYWAYVA